MKQILCGGGVAQEVFQVCGGELNKGLKEASLFRVAPCGVPEALEDLVTFPPIGEIVEVNSMPIVLRGLPLVSRERRWFRFWLTIGMAQGIPSWMWCLARYETIGGERTG